MNKPKDIITYYDTAEREPQSVIIEQHNKVTSVPLFSDTLEAFPELVLVVNNCRQIVAFNSKAANIFNETSEEKLLGKRFGEAINCIHNDDMKAGCGTTKFCGLCGMAKAIKFTKQILQTSQEECRILSSEDGVEIPYNFLVNTQPITIDGENFFIVAVSDISHQKRNELLGNVFFHDVLNTAGVINSIAYFLKEEQDDFDKEELLDSLISSSTQLIREIKNQRDLHHAELGELGVEIKDTSLNEILKNANDLYIYDNLTLGKNLSTEYMENDLTISTDKALLVRSLGNLLKNALEASDNNGIVKLYAHKSGSKIIFNVFNDKVIPQKTQMQIFQRSFSTKSKNGRGIGTYSVKLLIEKYLKGKVSFISNEEVKTIFTIEIPAE